MADPAKAFLFGRYRLVPDRRALFADGQEVPIRSRAFDLLLALVEQRDRVISKEELMALVWPGRVVEEGNLTVHIAGLRKLLGKGAIATLSHRGYRFVAPVQEANESTRRWAQQESAAAPPSEAPPSAMSGSTPDTLPRALTKLVGRVRDVDRVDALLGGSRLI